MVKRIHTVWVGWSLLGLLIGFSGCQSGSKPITDGPKPEPMVVLELTASDCTACPEIHRIFQNLRTRYQRQLEFLTLEISDSRTRRHAANTAQEFNAQFFLNRYDDRPGTVAVIHIKSGRALAVLDNETDEARYVETIDKILEEAHRPNWFNR